MDGLAEASGQGFEVIVFLSCLINLAAKRSF